MPARRCRAKSRPVFDGPGLQGVTGSTKRNSRAHCYRDVATDEVREASRARAPDSPSSSEGRKPERLDQTKNTYEETRLHCCDGVPAQNCNAIARPS